jgi:DNA polymerase-3 subunit gamma/tau
MSTQQLNLARKWRSKQFDQVVGQELSVRMLKNSLYLNQFFPVYLFSGQRGCGKTTTARVFAAALNCEQLPDFQNNPKSIVVPCLKCDSCLAMAAGNHPDFIEIDAASHTGVDNVRTIIEAASLMPVMGRKKLYLIDEAHMLSKAAFNAFLKILEEPPPSVVFMLATTDPQKIIDTVKSRCFQLFFNAINADTLTKHLQVVCSKEAIKADDEALYTIVKETEGSARDALNLLEQVRFSSGAITQQSVLRALGHLSEAQLLGILESVVEADVQGVIAYLQEIKFETYNATSIWQKLVELVRMALFAKYGAIDSSHLQNKERFEKLVRKSSAKQLGWFLQILYEQELLLAKTTVQHGLLEMVFIQMCGGTAQPVQAVPPIQAAVNHSAVVTAQKKTAAPVIPQAAAPVQAVTNVSDVRWSQFIEKVEQLSDPLLNSIFKQATFVLFEATTGKLVISFAQDGGLFGEWLKETEAIWMVPLKEFFGNNVHYVPQFEEKKTANVKQVKVAQPGVVQKENTGLPQVSQRAQTGMPNKISASAVRRRATVINVSDKQKWKTANQLLEAFGGTIVEVQGDEKKE